MSLISEQFLVFAAVLVLAFYLAPKRLQWVLLLLASCVFYAAAGLSNCGYIVITALSAYGAGLVLEKLAARGKARLAGKQSKLEQGGEKSLEGPGQRPAEVGHGRVPRFEFRAFVRVQIRGLCFAAGQ